MENKVTIRKGTIDDLPAILELIKELADFEKAPNEVSVTLAEMQHHGFGAHTIFEFFENMFLCYYSL